MKHIWNISCKQQLIFSGQHDFTDTASHLPTSVDVFPLFDQFDYKSGQIKVNEKQLWNLISKSFAWYLQSWYGPHCTLSILSTGWIQVYALGIKFRHETPYYIARCNRCFKIWHHSHSLKSNYREIKVCWVSFCEKPWPRM